MATSVGEPKVGMKVNWKTTQDGSPDDNFLKEDLVRNYKKEGFEIASITDTASGKVVTLKKDGEIVKRVEANGTRLHNLELNWSWLRPV